MRTTGVGLGSEDTQNRRAACSCRSPQPEGPSSKIPASIYGEPRGPPGPPTGGTTCLCPPGRLLRGCAALLRRPCAALLRRPPRPLVSIMLISVKMLGEVTPEEVKQCAALFSQHYGVWGALGPRPGQRVALSPARLAAACLFDDQCGVVQCRDASGGALLGHALFRRFTADAVVRGAALRGPAVWVTQLVVAEGARGQRLASSMLLQLCTRDVVAVGLLSCHPHAVRALARACAQTCVRAWIAGAAAALAAQAGVPYVRTADMRLDGSRCIAQTGFYVCHEQVNAILGSLPEPFELGALEDGQEFTAIAFPGLRQMSERSASMAALQTCCGWWWPAAGGSARG